MLPRISGNGDVCLQPDFRHSGIVPVGNRGLLIILSLAPVAVGYIWANQRCGRRAAVFTAALCAVWFELVYFSSKTLTEVVAAHILFLAIWLAYPGRPVDNRWRLVAGGAALGLVIVLRMQLAPPGPLWQLAPAAAAESAGLSLPPGRPWFC